MHGMMMFGVGPLFIVVVLVGWWFVIGGLRAADRRRRLHSRRPEAESAVSEGSGEAHLARLESTIFRLAAAHAGRLTLSDVVIGTGLPMKDAEKVMDRLSDGTHVRFEVTDSGTVYYEFPELASGAPANETRDAVSPPT